LSVDIHTVSE